MIHTRQETTMEWVALLTFVDEDHGKFYEEGGIYSQRRMPPCKFTRGGRRLTQGEHEATCPRCGHRFAATDDGTAESHRDLHFNGDEDIPSICAHLRSTRKLVTSRV
jgi:hypothetical protein